MRTLKSLFGQPTGTSSQDHAAKEFGPFVVDQARRTLTRDGRPLDCGPLPFDLLCLLVANHGQLVTRQQIRESVWANRTIEFDQAINSAIREVRRLLADDASNPSYVKTVPKHGYMFIGQLVSTKPSIAAKNWRWIATAGLFLVTSLVTYQWLGSSRAEHGNAFRQPRPEALAAYVRGQDILEQHDPARSAEAYALFRQALDADQDYALAWAGLADTLYFWRGDRFDRIAEANAAIDRALLLEPMLGRAIARRADILFTHDWDLAAAEQAFEQAREISPGDVRLRHSYSTFLLATGRKDAAIRELELALAIDPLSAVMTSDLAWTLELSGHHREALDKCRILAEIKPDDSRTVACPLRPLLSLGHIEEAAKVVRRLLPEEDRPPPSVASVQVLRRFWNLVAERAHEPVMVAIARARLGEPTAALEALELAHVQRSMLAPFIHLYPEFTALRTMPRFRALTIVENDRRQDRG